MKNNLSIFNNLRPLTVGFDDMFDHFEHMMDDRLFSNGTVGNFPPNNIVKPGKHTYNIELALAGLNKKDIEVDYEDNNLVFKSKKLDKTEADETTDENGNVLHRGISKRSFTRAFTIASDVEVQGAELKDGLLTVALERIIPDAKKARSIEIK